MLRPYSLAISVWREFQVFTSSSVRPRSSSPFHDFQPRSKNQSSTDGKARESTRSERILSNTSAARPETAPAAASAHARRKSPPTSAAAAATASGSRVAPDSASHTRQSLLKIFWSWRAFANRNVSTRMRTVGDSNSLFLRGTCASCPALRSAVAAGPISLTVRPSTTQSAARSPRSAMSRANMIGSRTHYVEHGRVSFVLRNDSAVLGNRRKA